jgi:hypothetical protein
VFTAADVEEGRSTLEGGIPVIGRRTLTLATLAVLAAPWAPAQAGVRIGVGIGLPFPAYRPYYYAPYPVYAAPVVYPAAVVYQPAYTVPAAPAPAPAAAPTLTPRPDVPPPLTAPGRQDEVDAALQQLAGGDDRGRADAALQLGRLRAGRAVDLLTRALEQDRSPAVREAAARGLGLIAAPAALTALQRAAQADEDRDVRRSASFAAEVIRANLQGRQ